MKKVGKRKMLEEKCINYIGTSCTYVWESAMLNDSLWSLGCQVCCCICYFCSISIVTQCPLQVMCLRATLLGVPCNYGKQHGHSTYKIDVLWVFLDPLDDDSSEGLWREKKGPVKQWQSEVLLPLLLDHPCWKFLHWNIPSKLFFSTFTLL